MSWEFAVLVILADDLTGALDAAAPFAGRGLETEVAVAVSAVPDALADGPAVLSVNVRSREIGAAEAQAATRAVLAALPADALLFKKVDSRLKGHIAAELDAMPYRSGLVAPAIPDFGRVVKAGHVQGFGVETPIPVAERLGDHGARVVIPDTITMEDLSTCLDEALAAGVDLLVGARGLAEALARRMTDGARAPLVAIPAGSGLFVIGSRDPITLAQIDRLRESPGVRHRPAPNGILPHPAESEAGITVVQAVPGAPPIPSDRVSRHLATSVHPALTAGAATLVLSGGATAEAVLDAMGIRRFRLRGECLPGLGIAFADGHCIIAKSGGFGVPDTLALIAAQLSRRMG